MFPGRIELSIDRREGKVIDYGGGLIPIKTAELQPDVEVEGILAPYRDKIEAVMSQVVGKSERDILNEPLDGSQSTPLGSLVCDAFRTVSGADIALYKSDGMRSHLFKGEIRKATLMALIPFEQKVVTAELSGRELKALAEFLMETPFLTQVSGMTLLYRPERAAGERIELLLPGGGPVRDDLMYACATVDYLYYFHYKRGGFDVLTKKRVEGALSRDTLEQYIREKQVIYPAGEKRVIRK